MDKETSFYNFGPKLLMTFCHKQAKMMSIIAKNQNIILGARSVCQPYMLPICYFNKIPNILDLAKYLL